MTNAVFPIAVQGQGLYASLHLMTEPENLERHAEEFAQLTVWFQAKKRQLGLDETPQGDMYDMYHP